jgi:hypothetical protein
MLVNPPPDHGPHKPRSSIRMDARLDAATRQKVDDLATRFRQPHAAVLSHIMQWGLSHGETLTPDQGEPQSPVHHLSLYIASDLHEQVQKAATAAGVKALPWLRHMVRQITITDFPASWQEATPTERSHDSPIFTERFMLRLDTTSSCKLQALVDRFDVPKAQIIRHLIAQAKPEDFPKSWQMRTAARHLPRVR